MNSEVKGLAIVRTFTGEVEAGNVQPIYDGTIQLFQSDKTW